MIDKILDRLANSIFDRMMSRIKDADSAIFQAGVQTGKNEIIDNPFIAACDIRNGEACYWSKGGFLRKRS